MAAQDSKNIRVPYFVRVLNRFSECYMLNFMRIDRGTDVQSDCKDASQETKSLKLTYVVINNGENLKSLPIQAGIVTRLVATRSKNVGDYLYDK